MNVSVNQENGRARLALKGRFDFTCHRGFKQAYEDAFAGGETKEVVVDIDKVKIEMPAEMTGTGAPADPASAVDPLKPAEVEAAADAEQKKIDDLFKDKK